MNLWKLGRALTLALFMWTTSITAAFAHALPGSVLTFSRGGDAVRLQIALALDDLIVASPDFGALADAAAGALDDATVSALDAYLAEHLAVQTAADAALTLQVESAALAVAEDHHAGTYQLLTIQMGAQTAAPADLLPLTLTYDAVMHEVRNHRAMVFWQNADSDPVWLAEFGFARIDGKPRSVILDLDSVSE